MACLALLPLLGLQACGGGALDAHVRVLNVASDFSSLDLYDGTTLDIEATATDAISGYSGYDEGSYTFNLKNHGSSTTSATLTSSLTKQKSYTLVAWEKAGVLTSTMLDENQSSPSSGNARLRFFHTAAAEVGAVDVYVTGNACASLPASDTPVVSSLSGLQDGYSDVTAATAGTEWHLCVTTAGDRTDVRLDLSSITFKSGQIGTMIFTAGSGGVLLNAKLLDQQGSLVAHANSSMRLRLVADAANAGAVAATINGTTLSSGVTSPVVGAYKLVTAGTLSGTVTINGTALTLPSLSGAAGSDVTLLVAGTAGAPTITLLTDDNTASTSTSKPVRVRLINGLNSSTEAAMMTIDGEVVADGVAFGAGSSPTSVAASSAAADLEVSSGSTTVVSATGQTLTSGKVYTMFLLGDLGGTTKGVLRAD